MTAPATTLPSSPPRSGSRTAALDGLRGLALLGMLAWHAHIGWMKGGFARMTIFFVLSGFLAAKSYLSLKHRDEPTPFRTFWKRRARRLLPISVLGIAAATAVTLLVGSEQARGSLRGDAASVIGYASNWRFIVNDQSYGALFERPSAFQHFWSLSLEEQCFWLLPLVVAGALFISRRRPWIAVAAVAAGLAAIPLFIAHTPDAAYYGTHVRGGEFLVGVVLALVLDRHGATIPAASRRLVQSLGAVSLVGLLAVMVFVDRSLPWLYQGGLGLFAIPAVLVVAAALIPTGPVPWALSFDPLVRIGRWAFPIYVLHWPIFMWLDAATDLSGTSLIVAQFGISIAVGAAVHHLLERPLMEGDWSWFARDRLAFGLVGGAMAVVLLIAALAPVAPPTYDFDTAMDRVNSNPADPVALDVTAAPDTRSRLAMFGGSTAVMLGAAAWPWSDSSEVLRAVPGDAQLGCGLVTAGSRVYARGGDGTLESAPPDDYCLDWEPRWSEALTHEGANVAFLMTGVWDTADWFLDGDDTWRSIGDPVFDDVLRDRLSVAIDTLGGDDRIVVLATTPVVGPGRDGSARELRGLADDHPERVARYNDLLHQVADSRADAWVLDYGTYVDAFGLDESAELFPDGVHPTQRAALDIWFDFLGPNLEGIVTATNHPEAVDA